MTAFFRRIVKDYEYMVFCLVRWLYLANVQPRQRTVHITADTGLIPNIIPQHALNRTEYAELTVLFLL